MLLTQRLLPLSVLATGLCACATTSLSAQQPVTRAQAAAAALARGARAAFGRADTAVAGAMLHGARLYPNPTAAASYTKDLPHYHVVADLPLDLPWIRSARIGAAASAQDAARYGFAFERAAIRFEVDTMYTRALAALARARLSHRNALDADSLHKMAQLRREVGDVSELDVRLAAVNAGQLENVAADDSVAGMQALLAVQLAMGLPAEEVTIALADSLASPPDSLAPPAGEPLPVAAAAASLRSSERALTLAHRTVFAAPSLQVGFDKDDPGGQRGLLPTAGLSLPFPLFNWNGGEVRQPSAARHRARAAPARRTRARRLPRGAPGERRRRHSSRRAGGGRREDSRRHATALPAGRHRHRHRDPAPRAFRGALGAWAHAGRAHLRHRRPAGGGRRLPGRVRAGAVRCGGAQRGDRALELGARLRPGGATGAGGNPASEGQRPGRGGSGAGTGRRDPRAPRAAARHPAGPAGRRRHANDRRARRSGGREPTARGRSRRVRAGCGLQCEPCAGRPDPRRRLGAPHRGGGRGR